jgi:hypothetical protein
MGDFARRYLRTLTAGTIAGIVAAFVAGGVGGRLVMRILAITSGPAARGAITENGNGVGELTAGGTIGLVLFATLFGSIGGLAYVAVRRWLPRRHRAIAYALFLTVITSPVLINPGNKDFRIFGPHPLAIVLFLALPFADGLIVVPLAERIERFYASRPLRFPDVLLYAPVLLLVPAAPFLVPAGLAFGLGLLVSSRDYLREAWESGWVDRAGRLVLAVALCGGLVLGGRDAARVHPRDVRPSDFHE